MSGQSHRGRRSQAAAFGAAAGIAAVGALLVLHVAACGTTASAPTRMEPPDGSGPSDGGSDTLETSTTMDAGGVGDAPATDGSIESACGAYASAYCAQYAACFPVAFKSSTFGTTQTCLDVITARCADESAAPGATWTLAQRMACTSALTTCDAIGWNAPVACTPSGTSPLGAACIFDTQCASTRCGGKASYGACGTCQTPDALDAGCDPAQPANPCARGLVCGEICQAPSPQGGPCPSPATDQCVAPAAQGAACSDPSDCGAGLTCIGQKCVPKRPVGQACAWSLDCAGDALCVSGQCVAATYAATGMPCSTTAPGGPLCTAQGLCLGGANKCYQRLGDGGTCMTTQECSPGLTCTGGACQFVSASSCH